MLHTGQQRLRRCGSTDGQYNLQIMWRDNEPHLLLLYHAVQQQVYKEWQESRCIIHAFLRRDNALTTVLNSLQDSYILTKFVLMTTALRIM